jgi:hypothetical protein
MSNVNGIGGQTIELPNELAAQYGLATAPAEVPEAKEVTPAAETIPAITPPAVEKPAESGVTPKVAEVEPKEGEGKKPYTREELDQIIDEENRTGRSLLDSSRLTPGELLTQRSLQRGATKKFEEAKRMKDEAEKIRADIEREKREAENQRLFNREAEELGPEEAQRNLRDRQRDEKIAMLEYENQQVRQREAGTQILNEYSKVSPKFHIPQDEDFTNMILGSIVGNDFRRVDGYPQTIEESTALFANKLGLTDDAVDNLWKLIRANPKNETAVKNFYINEHIKAKAAGNTVPSSSAANIQTPTKPSKDDISATDSTEDILKKRFGVTDLNQINLIK